MVHQELKSIADYIAEQILANGGEEGVHWRNALVKIMADKLGISTEHVDQTLDDQIDGALAINLGLMEENTDGM